MIETERLILRRFCAGDWKDLHEYLSDDEVVRYEPYDAFTEAMSRQEAVNRAGNDAFWAVCRKEDQKLIGNIYLEKQDFGTWELGYVFNRNYQHRGYASEAAEGLVRHAFHHCGARRITAMCNPLNEPSWRLLERIGFRREGHLIQNIYFKTDENGQPLWSDTYEYGLLDSEWNRV